MDKPYLVSSGCLGGKFLKSKGEYTVIPSMLFSSPHLATNVLAILMIFIKVKYIRNQPIFQNIEASVLADGLPPVDLDADEVNENVVDDGAPNNGFEN